MANSTAQSSAQSAPSYTGPFITLTFLFFAFGFITTLNGTLVPYLRSVFTLPYGWAMLATSAFFLAYLIFSAPSAKLIDAIGYKRTMIVSLFVQVVGVLMLVPAAKMPSFPLFLAAIFVVGAGVTALQNAANPYVTILGPEHSAPARLTLAQAANSMGTVVAPLIAGAFILKGATELPATASVAERVSAAASVIHPYLFIAAVLFLLGVIVIGLHLPQVARATKSAAEEAAAAKRSIWSCRHTVLATVGIFVYVGVEVGLSAIAINYFKEQGVSSATIPSFLNPLCRLFTFRHISDLTPTGIAAFLLSLYWLGMLLGRLAGSWILTKIPAGKLLAVLGVAGTVLLLISMRTHGSVAIWTVVLCGLANSIMFPNIFALGVAGLGPLTSKGSGLIMSACVGGAIIPPIVGKVADYVGIQHSFIILIACYLFVAYFGLWGSKPTRVED
ncbi:MAG: sugar MFS transporter [Acidobacteriaceae bacterium]|nr:sugar MFS transporter [Acidobacteriaceae bacterium]